MSIVLAARDCPLCGPGAPARLFADANAEPDQLNEFAFASRKLPEYMHWRLLQCQGCDLLYANPAPRPEDLGSLYHEAAFDSGTEAGFASRTYARFLPRIISRLPDRDGALDIGTGDGVFLGELLKAGFSRVRGVEPSAAPIAQADPKVKPLILHDLFRPGLFEPESFRLVTCFQTIEHVPEPLELCREAWRILKPRGALLLVGHNRKAFSAKVMGQKSPIFDIEHLQLFSERSMRALLERAGFGHIWVGTLFNKYPLSYWARLFPIPKRWKGRFLKILNRTPLARLVVPLPAGNMVAIGYKDGV